MTEAEENLIYDAMRAIQKHADCLAAVVAANGTPAAREAYQSGVYAPCIKLQVLLGPEALQRGHERHAIIAQKVAQYFASRPNDSQSP